MNALIVGIGGALGASVRYLLTIGATYPPAVTFLINIFGAMLLGIVAATTSERLRLLMGTGMLGGFTTYSALAVDTVQIMQDDVLIGLAYAVFTVVAGIAAAGFGLLLARSLGGTKP